MKEHSGLQPIIAKIEEYKKKYYTNLLFKGLLTGSALLISLFIFINFLEFFGRFGSVFRATLLFSFLAIALYTLFYLIIRPVFYLFKVNEPLDDQKAAEQIGKFFPDVKDKLLNTLQLAKRISSSDSQLLEASIVQKTADLRLVRFADAVNLNENRKYLKFIIPPVLGVLLISAISPSFFSKSTERIVYFRKDFAEEAPFKFKITNKDLQAVKNEDFNLHLKLIGDALPEDVFLVYNGRKFKMDSKDARNYDFTFSKVQDEIEFHFLASGFKSNSFDLGLVARPGLLSFNVKLKYPAYLNKSPETYDNVGNLIVPEGTLVEWDFKTADADSLSLLFDNSQKAMVNKRMFGDFSYQKKMINSANYQINLKNTFSSNNENISYYINVIPDKYPQIQLEQLKDTTMYAYIVLGGNITDDYGLSDFKLFYRKKKDGAGENTEAFASMDIPFNKNSLSQTFFHQMGLERFQLDKNDKLEYYLQLWDNDGVNGRKTTKTSVLTFAMPSSKEFDQEVEKQVNKAEDKLEDVLKKSKDLKKSLDNLDKTLKSKKEIDFQEKKQINDLINKKEELIKELKELQDQFRNLQEKQNRFNKQSPELQQKMDQLQNLMNDLMKNEDTKVYEELKKLLEEQQNEKAIEKLDKLKNSDRNLDRDIDRTLKLFKNLQLKQKVEETAKELEKLAEKQEKLAEKTENEKNPEKSDELKKEQEKISQEFQEKKDKLQEIDKLSKELKKEVDTKKDEQKSVSENQKNAEKQLDNKENKESGKSQKKAAKTMKAMAAEMSQSMQSAEMKQADLDMDALRDILENLVKLSFEQEKLMKEFRNISLVDPRFVKYSQEQLKLSDDAKVIEDSLYSLAKRVLQIESFITKEVTDMKNNMDESIQFIRDRKLNQASAKQQFSMTSMNNLALMLSDTFKQMQQMMSSPASGKGNKKGNMPMPGMEGIGEKQGELNKRMEGLGKDGQSGRQLSEELAKLANEQAQLRKQIQRMQEELNGTEQGKKVGNQLNDIKKQMEESENDLVNKRVNPTLIKRQKDIQTRLLEAEKAIKEQELDPKRKSTSAVTFNRTSPPDLEKFTKEKQKQLELIRTTPPNYTPFYKKQTDNYFKRIK